MNPDIFIIEKAKEAVSSLFGAALPDSSFQVQVTRKEFEGDYTLVVFGVGDYYERNTAVNYYKLHTNKLDEVDITFDLQITSKNESTVTYISTPSDLEQTWTVGAVRKEKYESFASEEEFKEFLLTAGNGFPIINTGVASGTLMYDYEWGLLQPGDYLL